ncbi:centrosomal protein CCDC61 isoform X2 [Nematostella vectensis]|uniref:centrosomal protein CCDC61 isoform X2 n=1 Tax=Nematostella vectensis TaxID=45351 RepID=UPI0020778FD5|nr:centrosomal protein CCDC61 isoform X2 [Nematostella vectensis]
MAQRFEEPTQTTTTRHVLRGIEYVLALTINKEENIFTLEVEDRLTADRWTGQFDTKYIEDLTHKTGNFKQFMVFVNMLESALNKNSSALSLDLLTYSDLEVLRNQRAHRPGSGTQHIPPAQPSSLHTKRYLIMTYSVEFDRIHYPLPLPYVGKPDPVQLQEALRRLEEENKRLKEQLLKRSTNGTVTHLQKEMESLAKERDDIQAQFETYQRELKHTGKANTAKEIRVLKKVVQNLESDLMKEKTKHQRIINKKNQEYRNIVEELEELRASERNLRARCRSLTNELAVFKRNSRVSPAPSNTSRRSSSRGSVPRPRRSTSHGRRSSSRDRLEMRDRRSASRDRLQMRDRRSASRDRIPSSGGRRRSPSPSGPRPPRFDPTAYIKEKQRKIQEAEKSRGRKRTLSGGSLPRGRSRSLSSDRLGTRLPSARKGSASKIGIPRTSSTGSLGSRRSSQSSTDGAVLTDQSNRQTRRRSSRSSKASVGSRGKENPRRPEDWTSPDDTDTGNYQALKHPTALYSSTPEHGRVHSRTKPTKTRHRHIINSEIEDSFNRSAEMMEIDARLNALQHFMKANLQ